MFLKKVQRRKKIKLRIKKNIKGSSKRPRLSVFRSNKEIYAQIINDNLSKTLLFVSSRDITDVDKKTKSQISKEVGIQIAKKILDLGLLKISFDRNGYLYHGRVKSLAEGIREGGVSF